MKPPIFKTVLCSALAMLVLHVSNATLLAEPAGPLEIPAPKTWEVTYSVDKEDQDYHLQKQGLETATCTLKHLTQANKGEDIDSLAKSQGKNVETFSGKTFQGRAVRNKASAAGIYISFSLTANQDSWYGVFTGSEEDWKELCKILGDAKPRAKSD